MWKNENFTLTEKIFRQINSLVTSLAKSLLSWNPHFVGHSDITWNQLLVKGNRQKFYIVILVTIWFSEFDENWFHVKNNGRDFLNFNTIKKIKDYKVNIFFLFWSFNFKGKTLISRNFFRFVTHTTVENWKIHSYRKIIRQINDLVNSFVKTLFSRNFCQKSVWVNLRTYIYTLCYLDLCYLWREIILINLLKGVEVKKFRTFSRNFRREVKKNHTHIVVIS